MAIQIYLQSIKVNKKITNNGKINSANDKPSQVVLNARPLVFSKNLEIADIGVIYINIGLGSFAGIRNSMSVVKAFNVAKNIDYYCYNLHDFKDEKDLSYESIPNLCKKYKIKKNLINPIYIS